MAPLRHSLRLGLRTLVVMIMVAAVARAVMITTYRVSGSSMLDALHDGDRILVADSDWLVQPVQTGDAVVVRVRGEVLVKRVAAGPGDSIAMDRGRVFRNGNFQREHIPPWLNRPDSFPEYRLDRDEYFLLGDNRRVSIDSRDFGPIRSAQIIGKVWLRFSGASLGTVAALDRQ